MESCMEVPQKVKKDLPYEPAISLHPKKMKTGYRRYPHSKIHYSIIHNIQGIKTTRVHQEINGQRKCSINTQQTITQP